MKALRNIESRTARESTNHYLPNTHKDSYLNSECLLTHSPSLSTYNRYNRYLSTYSSTKLLWGRLDSEGTGPADGQTTQERWKAILRGWIQGPRVPQGQA